MRVHFYLNKSGKSKKYTVICRVTGIEKYKLMNLNTKIYLDDEKYWDREKERVRTTGKGKSVRGVEINRALDSFKSEIERKVLRIRDENPNASFEEIKKAIKEAVEPKKSRDFWTAYDEFYKLKTSELSKNTLKSYKNLAAHLKEYERRHGKLTFGDIDFQFYDRFVGQLNHLKNGAVNLYFDKLKAFMNWSYDREYHSTLLYKKFKVRKLPPSEIIYLEEDELERVLKLELTGKTERVKDAFCFASQTGARYSDVKSLNINREIDFEKRIWKLTTQKTRDIIKVPLNDIALEIVKKYRERGNFGLNNLSNPSYYHVKKIGKLAGIDAQINAKETTDNGVETKNFKKYELMGFHTARKTFVTLSLMKGMSVQMIMEITGHKNFKTLQRYLKITDRQVQDEYDKAWNSNA